MSGKPGEKRRDARGGIGAHDVTDNDPPQGTDRNSLRTAHAVAEADEDRSVDDIAHADVGNRHILEESTIDSLQGKAPAAIKDAIRNSNTFETTIRFGAKLDPAIARNIGLCRKRLTGTIQ